MLYFDFLEKSLELVSPRCYQNEEPEVTGSNER